jgi:perosamine synthetase
MNKKIKFAEPYVFDEEAEAAAEVVRSKWLVGGAKLQEFESLFASKCEVPHAIGVSSWTMGAFLVLHAWGIGPGDEVIVPSYTFIASVNVVSHVGAKPIFVDIDPVTWNISPTEVEKHITPRTRAIIAVDQLGLPCDIDKINQIATTYDLLVLDDAACALGSKNKGRPVGSLSDVSIFSLHARKIITTGEGGMITTKNQELAKRLKILRHQGMSINDFHRDKLAPTIFEEYPEVGFNARFTDIQASIGIVQMGRLPEIIDKRRKIADIYNAELCNIDSIILPTEPDGLLSNWQSYMIGLTGTTTTGRDTLMEELFELEIPTRRSVMASHLESPYKNNRCILPNTENAFSRNLLIPMHAGLTEDQQNYIIQSLKSAINNL